jgi:hypothetical protein
MDGLTVSDLRQGHSYTITFAYTAGPRFITGSMRAEFVGKTNEGAYAFRLDRDRPYLALPAEFIRHIDPAERREGPALHTNFGRELRAPGHPPFDVRFG